MLKLNRVVDYGILVLTEIARRNACVSTTELAAAFGISATIVAKVLKKLARAGLVTSERGSRGGYRLATGDDLAHQVDDPLDVRHPFGEPVGAKCLRTVAQRVLR